MRIFLYIVLLISFSLMQTARAQTTESPKSTRIEVDSDLGEIRFVIDGIVSVVVNPEGIHARNNVQYGGQIKDIGDEFSFQNNKDQIRKEKDVK